MEDEAISLRGLAALRRETKRFALPAASADGSIGCHFEVIHDADNRATKAR
jgi:hypothetical protein